MLMMTEVSRIVESVNEENAINSGRRYHPRTSGVHVLFCGDLNSLPDSGKSCSVFPALAVYHRSAVASRQCPQLFLSILGSAIFATMYYFIYFQFITYISLSSYCMALNI